MAIIVVAAVSGTLAWIGAVVAEVAAQVMIHTASGEGEGEVADINRPMTVWKARMTIHITTVLVLGATAIEAKALIIQMIVAAAHALLDAVSAERRSITTTIGLPVQALQRRRAPRASVISVIIVERIKTEVEIKRRTGHP